MNSYYVYVYLDPRKQGDFNYGAYHFNYEPFYVGKGKGRRYKDHLKPLGTGGSPHKNRRIRNITDTGLFPVIVKLCENLQEEDALSCEMGLIAMIGRRDLKSGPLTNLTDGGEGPSGCRRSDETKRKISVASKGRTATPETRQKLSEAGKGRRHAEATKIKMSQVQKKYWAEHPPVVSPERIEKMAAKRRGQKLTDEHKRKISEAKKGIRRQPFSDEWLLNMSAARKGKASPIKGRKLTVEHKQKISASLEGNQHTLGYKATQQTLAKRSAYWARRRESIQLLQFWAAL